MTTPQLEKILIADEGLKLKPYRCPAGKWTIGVGHNLEVDGLTEEQIKSVYGGGITKDHAMRLLNDDVNEAIAGAKTALGKTYGDLSIPRQYAVINLCFQLGGAGFAKFKRTIAAIKNSDWRLAETCLRSSRWARQTPKRAERVIKLLCREVYDPAYV